MSETRQRLDKWLWFARFAKSRTLASALVSDGHVRVNGQRAQAPAKPVVPGDVLTIAAPRRTLVIRILGVGERRGPAPEAQALYEALDRGDNGALVTGASDD